LLGSNDIEKSCLQCGHIVYHRNPLLGLGRLDLDADFDDKTAPHPPDRGSQRRDEPK
jgi:hypothetical protein